MMPRRPGPRALAALILLIVLAIATWSDARPGGGESYGGGGGGGGSSSSGGGGSSGGSGGDLAFLIFLVRLCWEHPLVGIPLVSALAGYVALSARSGARRTNWDSMQSSGAATSAPSRPAAAALAQIAQVDPDFSPIVFEDFVFRLYAAAHRSRGDGTLKELAPYIAEQARAALTGREPSGIVSGVVVGAMHVRRVDVSEAPSGQAAAGVVTVRIEFEANYSVGSGYGSRHFVIEDWVLERAVTARTRPPEPGRRFPCPNCGAPWRADEAAGTQKCSSCGEVVDNGRFDWQVTGIHLRQDRSNIPGLEQEVQERGTDDPTIKDPRFKPQWAAFMQSDPGVTAQSIEARLRHIYKVLNDAWTEQDLKPARTVLSDGLADYLQYWLDAYEQQYLRNVLEDMRITRHVLVKLRRDRYYDALTIRIWGRGKDYVVGTANGRHVRGSRTSDRAYSEYWTLIRSAARRGAPRAEATCGGCGAPLVVSMAGACSHCGAHVTAGEFDWVLSKIEQDDSYRG